MRLKANLAKAYSRIKGRLCEGDWDDEDYHMPTVGSRSEQHNENIQNLH